MGWSGDFKRFMNRLLSFWVETIAAILSGQGLNEIVYFLTLFN